jgi:CubicO group peptidase (beta-lactamase class C family)
VSGQRALPEQPSLRHLKLEAKRRLAAGEFSTLHGSQLAVAREHGQPSWTALKAAVDARGPADGRAVEQLRWIAARFGDAAEHGWTAPGEPELREHFTDEFLAHVTPERLIAIFTAAPDELREELVVVASTALSAQCRIAGRLVAAVSEPTAPYRLAGMQLRQLGERVSDDRTASPSTVTEGAAPAGVAGIAADAIARLGLPGVGLAGRVRGEPGWASATGWADLDRGEPLQPGHAFPAYGITTVVTAVAVLRLVADGRLGLDEAANRYLGAVRLGDDEVTVRQLLSHAGGVIDPEPPPAPAVPDPTVPDPTVPDPPAVIGPVIACAGRRGTYRFSAAGYAALGEIVAGLADQPYPEAVSRLVLQPLAMAASWFPAGWPSPERVPAPIVTCYDVGAGGVFEAVPGRAPAVMAAAGLWSTAADLVRFGLDWRSLLPRQLADQAVRPHVAITTGPKAGLGWLVNEPLGLAGQAGGGAGGAASLIVTLDGRRAQAALANRLIPIEPVNAAALRAAGGLSGVGAGVD